MAGRHAQAHAQTAQPVPSQRWASGGPAHTAKQQHAHVPFVVPSTMEPFVAIVPLYESGKPHLSSRPMSSLCQGLPSCMHGGTHTRHSKRVRTQTVAISLWASARVTSSYLRCPKNAQKARTGSHASCFGFFFESAHAVSAHCAPDALDMLGAGWCSDQVACRRCADEGFPGTRPTPRSTSPLRPKASQFLSCQHYFGRRLLKISKSPPRAIFFDTI